MTLFPEVCKVNVDEAFTNLIRYCSEENLCKVDEKILRQSVISQHKGNI